ncbi:Leucine rich repeat-containing protein [Ruminococcus sp. YE71]|uniref:fibronectin type III domain-containing protein n=1 Tax=unclassified Ruminococcus TaxID=2608920 RepID=UPI0008915B9F|nr:MULTISPECIES: fibronectin type III domain-containing protein [unclassified Ruminococcus]SDA20152.1 Leucine rich repeat-containing protein [Ruminococcus sp. YE78]SFW31916.1 Leucine rich repeat-containing protein [Ruminococcus sp. YE71]
MTKNITKRTVSGVLAVLCAAGVMMAQPYVGGVAADTAVTVSADKIFGDYEYKVLDDGTAEITKYTGSDKVVEIPSEIGGYVLTSIGQRAFAFCTSLESVSIPDSVTTIGQKAFASCFLLSSVTIPESVTSIEKGAFTYCSSLTSVTIPDSIDSIKEDTFYNCTSLTSITISDSVTSIGSGAFTYCSSLKSVTIPDSMTSIGSHSFCDCTALTSVTIPGNVTKIGKYAFGMIYDETIEELVRLNGFKIYCYPGTSGEEYAIDNGFEYELIDGKKQNPTVTFEKGNGAVRLNWTEVEGAEKYAVVAFVSGSWTKVTEVVETSYVLKGLSPGKQYKVAVLAKIDGEWNKDISNAIIVTPNALTYPEANVEVQGNAFRLSWTAVPNAQKYVIGYTTNGKSWKPAKTVGAGTTLFTYKNAPKGTYYLVVGAYVNGKLDTTDLVNRVVRVVIK